MAFRSHYLPFIGYLLVSGVNFNIGNIWALKAAGQIGVCMCAHQHRFLPSTPKHTETQNCTSRDSRGCWAGSGYAGSLSRQIGHPFCSLTLSAQNGLRKGAEGWLHRRTEKGTSRDGIHFALCPLQFKSDSTWRKKSPEVKGTTLQKAEGEAASTALGSSRQSTQVRRLRVSSSS